VAALVLALGAAMFVYEQLFREEPAAYFESGEDHFLFGSVGSETETGVPYWIWLVLPRVFPDLLPGAGGYSALGIVAKPGYEMPIGLSKVTIGYPRVGANCAMCHTASVRVAPDALPTIVPGAPAHQLAAQRYFRFLSDAAADPRFTAGTLLGEIAKNYRLSLTERLLYRFVIVPSTRRALLRVRDQSTWMDAGPAWGHGRADLFNTIKAGRLAQPSDRTVATADMLPLWNLASPREGGYFWTGMNTDLREVVRASALAVGASRAWLDRDSRQWDESDARASSSLRRVLDYIGTHQPAKYPLPVDQQLASAGAGVFRTECASCHAPEGRRPGQVVPVADVGTDRHRVDAWTMAAADALNAYGEGRDWKLSGFTAPRGYAAVPLDGVWLRAPYLHNGSVPTLADLLEPAERRPRVFWRGYDVIDPVKVGFIAEGTAAERRGSRYDTSRPGNGNAGHEYGTALAPELKRALLEYLKTL
jgi:mono/diheme cytochrome c family protein